MMQADELLALRADVYEVVVTTEPATHVHRTLTAPGRDNDPRPFSLVNVRLEPQASVYVCIWARYSQAEIARQKREWEAYATKAGVR